MSCLPKVTALVPSYNHGHFIQQRIESIFEQTYKNLEVIVIDDRSEDDSNEIITNLLSKYEFRYIRNEKNSGTPFAAWESVLLHATGSYIWVCESDDFAESGFLETAVNALEADKGAVLFYCNSWVVDSCGQRVGHTDTYFHNIWKETRWDSDFFAEGQQELVEFQLRGQTVPNMSSALISAEAFRAAYTPFLKKLRLTGDWLFIGNVLHHGNVLFSKLTMNNFRCHKETARVRVKSSRTQAEFILAIYLLFRGANRPVREFSRLIAPAAARSLFGPAKLSDVLKELLEISWSATFRCMLLLAISMPMNIGHFGMYYKRYNHIYKRN